MRTALELFVLLTGGDTRQIDNELEKIDTFLGKDRAVPIELVRELVPLSRAGVIFELSNALSARDLELALTLVRRLLEQGESAIGILLAAVVPTIRNLLLAKDLMEAAWDPASAFAISIHCRHEPAARKRQRSICLAKKTAQLTPMVWASLRNTRISSIPMN